MKKEIKAETTLASTIHDTLRELLNDPSDFIPLHKPVFFGREREYITDAINSTFVSSVGAYVDRFEEALADFCGVERAVATVNGTAALHIALLVAGVEPNDEVILPSLTFVATANAVRYACAVPHFVDAEDRTLGIDPEKLGTHLERVAGLRSGDCYNQETGRRIRALVPMHTFGMPSRLVKLLEVADRFGLVLVEDAAESLGSYYNGKHCGSFGKVSSLSFNGNKVITTGGGGAILTNDEDLADQAKHITTTAKVPHKWRYDHDMVGYNYRMPNLNAALGVAQLEQLPGILKQKRDLSDRYEKAFQNVDGAMFLKEPDGCTSNYWLNALLLDRGNEGALEPILEATNNKGIMTRPAWTPMHQLPMFKDCPRMDLATAEDLVSRLINVPSSAGL